MKHLSLFSGIGGFDLASHWMGWDNVAAVEKEPFCQKVLKKNFPNLKIYGDIKEFDGKPYKGAVDIISGGFPCQPFSVAGGRKGKDDDRHLWPEMLRIIKEVEPRFIVGENVAGIISMENGLVLKRILSDLENLSYKVQCFNIPASATQAPHQRQRVWIVANRHQYDKRGKAGRNEKASSKERVQKRDKVERAGKPDSIFHISNALRNRSQRQRGDRGQVRTEQGIEKEANKFKHDHNFKKTWVEVAARTCRVDDGIPRRVDRSKRIKALGNAIVPQIAFQIFKAIETLTK